MDGTRTTPTVVVQIVALVLVLVLAIVLATTRDKEVWIERNVRL